MLSFHVISSIDLIVVHESTLSFTNVKNSANVEKFAKLPKTLTASCDFDYLAEKLTLSFKSSHAVFQPMALKVYFRKCQIVAVNFVKGFQVFFPKDVFSIPVSFHKIPIDLFGFSSDRIFMIVLEYNSGVHPTAHVVSTKLEATFTITLPVIKTNEIFFNAPGTTQPSPSIRRICQQGFKMIDTNTYEEIETCVILEEFKLIAPEERYKVHGYVSMLGLFLDIENSFELDLLKKSDLVGVKIFKQNLTHYRIDVSFGLKRVADVLIISFDLDTRPDSESCKLSTHDTSISSTPAVDPQGAAQVSDQRAHQRFPS